MNTPSIYIVVLQNPTKKDHVSLEQADFKLKTGIEQGDTGLSCTRKPVIKY